MASPSSVKRSYFSGIINLVSKIAEHNVCHAAYQQDIFFVQAFEAGNIDCGLVLDQRKADLLDYTTLNTERLMLFTEYGVQKSTPIIPLEIKSANPCFQHTGNALTTWCFSNEQWKKAEVAILVSIKDPKSIGMVPMKILRRNDKSRSPMFNCLSREKRTWLSSISIRPMWTLHPLAAFPPELAPFMLPLDELGQAFGDIKQMNLDQSNIWKNRHTGIEYDINARLDSHKIKALDPLHQAHLNAQAYVNRLYKAFSESTSRFTVDFFACAGFFGDFKLINQFSGTQVFVEMKTGHCWLTRTNIPGARTQMQHTQDRMGHRPGLIFSWKAQWDYLYTDVETNSRVKEALFIPRDAVPEAWWNSPGQDGKLDWASHTDCDIEDFVVSTADDSRLCRDIENILSRYDPGLWKAAHRIPVETIADVVDDDTVAEIIEPDGPPPNEPRVEFSTRGFRRGFGSSLHRQIRGNTYQVWAAEALQELCRMNGQALVLNVGRTNLKFQFLIARYEWSTADKQRYDETGIAPCQVWHFHNKTPVIPITFLETEWDFSSPKSYNRTMYLLTKIASWSPSIVICDIFPAHCIRMAHNRYVLPNCLLPSKCGKHQPWNISEGSLDDFSVDQDALFDPILQLMTHQETVTFGDLKSAVRTKSYLASLGQVLQATVDQCCPAEDDE